MLGNNFTDHDREINCLLQCLEVEVDESRADVAIIVGVLEVCPLYLLVRFANIIKHPLVK